MFRTLARSALILAAVAGSLTAQAKPKSPPVPRPVWPDEGPLKWTPRPTVPEITANDLRTRLYQLADDSMQGRRIGELGNFKGTAYIAAEFKRMGLKPAGDNGTYFQDLDYGTSVFDSTSLSLVVAGAALTPKREFMPTVPTAANGAATRVNMQNVPTIFAGVAGDTTVRLDPAMFRGKVAVFVGPADGGGNGRGGRGGAGGGGGARGGGGPAAVCSADQGWPNQRGAAYALSLPPAAARAGGGRGGRDPRLASSGIVGVLTAADALPANAGFATARGMFPVAGANALPTATISADAVMKIFGKPAAQLTVGMAGQPISATWNYVSTMSPTPAPT